jgi:5-formyltetrahydrofolate cyclo-ligase
MTPRQIRQSIREKRRLLSDSVRRVASRQIFQRIVKRTEFQTADSIALFLAFDGEPDLSELISTAWDQGKQVFLPLVHGKGQPMTFAAYDRSTNLVANRWGILEPDPSTARLIEPSKLNCVLTPLVAFDANCHRIGVGGGFYDRTFAFTKASDSDTRPKLIGVAFEFQKIESIEPQPWDVQLDSIVTESNEYLAS